MQVVVNISAIIAMKSGGTAPALARSACAATLE